MSKVTFFLLVITLIMCIIVQTILAALTLQENEERQLAGCGHQAAHVSKLIISINYFTFNIRFEHF